MPSPYTYCHYYHLPPHRHTAHLHTTGCSYLVPHLTVPTTIPHHHLQLPLCSATYTTTTAYLYTVSHHYLPTHTHSLHAAFCIFTFHCHTMDLHTAFSSAGFPLVPFCSYCTAMVWVLRTTLHTCTWDLLFAACSCCTHLPAAYLLPALPVHTHLRIHTPHHLLPHLHLLPSPRSCLRLHFSFLLGLYPATLPYPVSTFYCLPAPSPPPY